MSKWSQKITTGKQRKPLLMGIYGMEGVGKSTFAAKAPEPLFIGAENGTNHLSVARLEGFKSWEDVNEAMTEIEQSKDFEQYKTLVIDSLDWLEPLIEAHVLKGQAGKTMNSAHGGYSKAYDISNTLWRELMGRLDKLRNDRGMNIIVIAHSKVEHKFEPTTQSTYDRYCLQLYKTSAALWRQYLDSLFFFGFEMVVGRTSQTETKTVTTGKRLLYPILTSGFDAKNRYNMVSPVDLSLTWQQFADMVADQDGPSLEYLQAEVQGLVARCLAELHDEELRVKVVEQFDKMRNDATKLPLLAERIKALLGAQQ
jgi:hypothetical protein